MKIADWLAAHRLIWGDLFAGFKLVLKGGLLLVGAGVMVFTIALFTQPEVKSLVAREVANSAVSLSQASAEIAAELSVQSSDAQPNLWLAAVPAVKFSALPRDQQQAALFLARKYRLSPDAVAGIVAQTYGIAYELRLDPLLVLAVMSIESSMNPLAQSSVGAQGLMQVMTTVHSERFEEFGGAAAALNPMANIRVGAEILRDLIQRWGSTQSALKAYVGAATQPDDGGYGLRVLTERARLEAAVTGKPFRRPFLEKTETTVAEQQEALPTSSAEPAAETSPLPLVPLMPLPSLPTHAPLHPQNDA